ncbi:MAG: gliding motility-associated C-terminal domain-containing protein, partial [Bacteroidales bacterium]|nr:gliding motility-associated C-terminal domain-containing protein [Bacteroidales bacterium]
TITTLNAVKTFSDTTEIKVRLISGIANDQCVDILDTIIKLERPYPNLNIFGDSVVCKNDTAVLFANHTGLSFWSNQDTTNSISFIPLIDTIYSLELIDSLGCYHIDSINIKVNPRDTTYITAEICDNQMYTSNGFNTNSPGIHELKLISKNNCDSTVYLNLTVHPTYNDTIYAEICNGTVYNLNGFNDSITGLYTLSLQTTKGCDSIVNLNLSVNPTYNDTINAIICEGETYTDNGFYENITGIYTQNLVTYKGCDSIVNLNLIVGQKYNDTILADICLGEAYNDFGFNETQEGFYTHPFLSQYGCDSIVNLSLLVHNPYFDTIIDTICQGDIYEYGFDADSTGTYIQNLQTTFGCDSILVLHLQVNPVYHDTIKADIYKGNVYNQHGFNEKETGVYTRELKTYLGCDSIIYLDLQVDNVLFSNVVTPNGDGINDVFKLNNLVEQDAFPENELIIFNRQGKMIYQKKNIKIDTDFWDPEQTKTPNGTYFFRFIGTRYDKKIDKVGSIEVLR